MSTERLYTALVPSRKELEERRRRERHTYGAKVERPATEEEEEDEYANHPAGVRVPLRSAYLSQQASVPSIPLARVRDMLLQFPKDGLRKAAGSFGLLPPANEEETTDERETLVAALVAGLAANQLKKIKPALVLVLKPDVMWAECKAATPGPMVVEGEAAPVLDALLKLDLAKRIEAVVAAAGGPEALIKICAGKVSAASKHAEQSGLCKRWRERYGKPEYGYTAMRRLYADATSSTDYKARDAVALEVEKHAFDVLRRLLGAQRAAECIEFSDEAGRQGKGATFGPQWKVFVYLALRLRQDVNA